MTRTELIYMEDCYTKEFDAEVTKKGENFVVLDKTSFYPEGGGQPSDKGKLISDGEEYEVTGVKKHKGEVRHIIKGEVPEENEKVQGKIDWERRHKLMRMHTAQHLVAAIVLYKYDATVSGNQIHLENSRIDFNPVNFSEEDLEGIQERANQLIEKGRPVEIYQMSREKVEEKMDPERVNLDLIPESVDPLRIVEIEELDICPCGGTHVKNLEEIKGIDIIERETKGKNTDRLTFELKEA